MPAKPIPPPADRRRSHRRAIDSTLAEWRSRGHLVGHENAAARAILRSLADTADTAEAQLGAGTASAFTVSRVIEALAGKVAQYAPPTVAAPDPRSVDLEERALAIIASVTEAGDAGDVGTTTQPRPTQQKENRK